MEYWAGLLSGHCSGPGWSFCSGTATSQRVQLPYSCTFLVTTIPFLSCAEIMHEYRLQPDGSLRGRQRSCLYLQPQEPRFFEAGGRAVAVYDYDYIMRRVPPPEDAPAEAAACVLTPKSVWQCV